MLQVLFAKMFKKPSAISILQVHQATLCFGLSVLLQVEWPSNLLDDSPTTESIGMEIYWMMETRKNWMFESLPITDP